MTNWVYNALTVEGDISPIHMFRSKVSTPYNYLEKDFDLTTGESISTNILVESPLSLWNIISPPKEFLSLYFATADGTEDKNWNWYHWNPINWGTKWDVNNVEVLDSSDSRLVYRFETAWDSPKAVITTASNDYPDLTFRLDFSGEEGWGGFLILKAGNVIEIKNWDTPDSHLDFEANGNTCWCINSEEEYFDDCPKKPDERLKAHF
jgi:hypothetical protein